jgi:hypothetical protein
MGPLGMSRNSRRQLDLEQQQPVENFGHQLLPATTVHSNCPLVERSNNNKTQAAVQHRIIHGFLFFQKKNTERFLTFAQNLNFQLVWVGYCMQIKLNTD